MTVHVLKEILLKCDVLMQDSQKTGKETLKKNKEKKHIFQSYNSREIITAKFGKPKKPQQASPLLLLFGIRDDDGGMMYREFCLCFILRIIAPTLLSLLLLFLQLVAVFELLFLLLVCM